MKIAIVINNSSGLYLFRKELILSLLAEGHDVVAITPLEDRVDQLKKTGIKIIDTPIDRRGINPLVDYALFNKYRKILIQEEPDVVVTYTIKPNIYAGIACRQLKISYVGNVTGLGSAFERGGILRKIAVLLNKAGLKNAKHVFFENASNMNMFIDEKIVGEDRAVLLNGAGVDLDYFRVASYPENSEQTVFLFMGRVMREKGVDELFEAMQRLVKEGYSCRLVVLGQFEEDYEAQIAEYESQGWLTYYGYQMDVRPFINACNCFVLPSYHEGMANTNLESAASGRPIITSNIPGCKEAVAANESGFLCDVKSSDSLYEQMKKFIHLPYDQKRIMGLKGRNHMEKNFDKKDVVRKTVYYITQ